MTVKVPGTGAPTAQQPTAADFVTRCLAQTGKRYVFGAHGPNSFDCSGLIIGELQAMGYSGLPGDSDGLRDWSKGAGLAIPVEKAYTVRGAMIGRSGKGTNGHVVVSLGDGTTIEARGTQYGVGSWGAKGRNFDWAGLIPGLRYGVAGTMLVAETPQGDSSSGGGYGAIVDFLKAVADPNTWRRIGMVALGAALLLVGLGIVKGDVWGYVPLVGG